MQNDAVALLTPPSSAYSGLVVYAQGLAAALTGQGFLTTILPQSGEVLTGRFIEQYKFVAWIGFGESPDLLKLAVRSMSETCGRTTHIIFPEWELHESNDLFLALQPLAHLRMRFIAAPGQPAHPMLTGCWVSSELPTPVQIPMGACTGLTNPRSLSAIYLGRASDSKKVVELANYWQDSELDRIVELFLYLDRVPGQLVRRLRNSRIWCMQLQRAPYPGRFELFSASTFYISASSMEFSPLAPVEAMAMGCVPVLRDIRAHNVLIERSCGGFVFRDFQEMERGLRAFASSQEMVEGHSSCARSYVQTAHSFAAVADAFWRLAAAPVFGT